MSNLPAVEATKRAVHDTRTRVLLSKTKMTSPAACISASPFRNRSPSG